jgi:hypothetical protein
VQLPGNTSIYADSVELLLNGEPFLVEKNKKIDALDIASLYVDFVVERKDWGQDGEKTLSARIKDKAGNYGLVSDKIRFKLKTSIANHRQ